MNEQYTFPDNPIETLSYYDTIVLTATLYDKSPGGIARSKAAQEFLKNSTLTGIQIIICDGGSEKYFLDFVKTFTNVILLEYHDDPEIQKSHAPRRKNGMKYILENFPDKEYFLWIEPEKAEILFPKNLSKIIVPLREGKAKQTIPTPKPNDNRPAYMRAIEMRAIRRAMDIVSYGKFRPKNDTYEINENLTMEQRIKKIYDEPGNANKIIDHWFGPHAFTREIAENYFMKNNRKIWDWIIISSSKAQYDGNTTLGISIDFHYAPSQLADENSPERISELKKKRLLQYKTLIRAFREEFINKLNIK